MFESYRVNCKRKGFKSIFPDFLMADIDLESMLRYWTPTTRPLEEKSRNVLNILYQYDVTQARQLRQPDARGPPKGIDLAEWTRRATEELRGPAGELTEELVRQRYVLIEPHGCVLKCKGYDAFESRNFVYSKLMLSLYYLATEKKRPSVRLTTLANFAGINLDAAGHYTKFLEHQGLICKKNSLNPNTKRYNTWVELTELGHQFMEYFNSDRAAAYKSSLLLAWQAEIKGLPAR